MLRNPKEEILEAAQIAVDALVAQYRHDVAIIEEVGRVQLERMATAARISNDKGLLLRAVLIQQDRYSIFASLTTKEKALKAEQQALWDSMFYANPVIWLMYKYQAYTGNNVIATLRDLKRHCEPHDYICTKRFHFLNERLRRSNQPLLTDTAHYPDTMEMPELYAAPVIIGLVQEEDFMRQWRWHEFYKDEGRVAKWEDYIVS